MRCVALSLLFLSACKTAESGPLPPPVADLQAIVEQKPKPPKAILTDPDANDRYNESVEAWGDRIRAAGVKLCSFYENTGMAVNCGD